MVGCCMRCKSRLAMFSLDLLGDFMMYKIWSGKKIKMEIENVKNFLLLKWYAIYDAVLLLILFVSSVYLSHAALNSNSNCNCNCLSFLNGKTVRTISIKKVAHSIQFNSFNSWFLLHLHPHIRVIGKSWRLCVRHSVINSCRIITFLLLMTFLFTQNAVKCVNRRINLRIPCDMDRERARDEEMKTERDAMSLYLF